MRSKGEEMKKIGSVIAAVVLVLGIALIAPSAEAGCFAAYAQAVDSCSNLSSGWDRSICGLDAATELAGCVNRTVSGG